MYKLKKIVGSSNFSVQFINFHCKNISLGPIDNIRQYFLKNKRIKRYHIKDMGCSLLISIYILLRYSVVFTVESLSLLYLLLYLDLYVLGDDALIS